MSHQLKKTIPVPSCVAELPPELRFNLDQSADLAALRISAVYQVTQEERAQAALTKASNGSEAMGQAITALKTHRPGKGFDPYGGWVLFVEKYTPTSRDDFIYQRALAQFKMFAMIHEDGEEAANAIITALALGIQAYLLQPANAPAQA